MFRIIIIALVFCSCLNREDVKNHSLTCVDETISLLIDSIGFFDNITELEVFDTIKNEHLSITIKSVKKEVFFEFLKQNIENTRYFNRAYKVNEYLNNGKSVRKGDSLIVLTDYNKKYILVDEGEVKKPSNRRFFLDNIIGDFLFFKEIWFEDIYSYVYDSKNNEQLLGCPSLSLFSNAKDSIILMSCSYRSYPGVKEPLQFLKIKENSIDTILSINTYWTPSLVIFDKNEPFGYFIYTHIQDYESISTYARIDYKLRNEF